MMRARRSLRPQPKQNASPELKGKAPLTEAVDSPKVKKRKTPPRKVGESSARRQRAPPRHLHPQLLAPAGLQPRAILGGRWRERGERQLVTGEPGQAPSP
uniref:Uncharacterized protein n=1 Tax=Oryza glumipatula TaxID=40148 RepID=A0A0D9YUY3_9ORYZ